MLVYINYEGKSERLQEAIHLDDIRSISSVQSISKDSYCFSILVRSDENTFEGFYSKEYKTKEEAEMAQMSTISQINALEIMYEKAKHIPEDRLTPVYFQVIDPAQKKLVPGRVTLFEQPVYTIII